MDDAAIVEYLKRRPQEVRLSELDPQLPQPIPFDEAHRCTHLDEDDEDIRPAEERHVYCIAIPIPHGSGTISTVFAVTEHHDRIVGEYCDPRREKPRKAKVPARRKPRKADKSQ